MSIELGRWRKGDGRKGREDGVVGWGWDEEEWRDEPRAYNEIHRKHKRRSKSSHRALEPVREEQGRFTKFHTPDQRESPGQIIFYLFSVFVILLSIAFFGRDQFRIPSSPNSPLIVPGWDSANSVQAQSRPPSRNVRLWNGLVSSPRLPIVPSCRSSTHSTAYLAISRRL